MAFTPYRYIQCNKCKDKLGPYGQVGFYYVGDRKAVMECECHSQWRYKNLTFIRADKNSIWVEKPNIEYSLITSYLGVKSIDEIKKVDQYIQNYASKPSLRKVCMYFTGITQTQKTTVAQHVGLSLYRSGFTALYTTMKRFISAIGNPYPKEDQIEMVQSFMAKAESADLIIIDEAFDRNASPVYEGGNQSSYIEGYLRDRIHTKGKGVLFVSKVPPELIQKNGYSESLQSYIMQITTNRRTALVFRDFVKPTDIDSIFAEVL
jgi:hypothetical protein